MRLKLIIGILVILVLISGCVRDILPIDDITPYVKQIPQIKEFLKQNPNTDIVVTYWSEDEIKPIINSISEKCGKEMTSVAMYKAIGVDYNNEIIAWVRASDKQVLCVLRKVDKESESEVLIESQINESKLKLNNQMAEKYSGKYSYAGYLKMGEKPLTITIDSKNYTLRLMDTSPYANIDINNKKYLNMNINDKVYIDNGVIFTLLDIPIKRCKESSPKCRETIKFHVGKEFNRTYLEGNVSLTINDISFEIKEDNTVKRIKIDYTIKNEWGDIRSEIRLYLLEHKDNIEIVNIDELKAGAVITKETELSFGYDDIHQTQTLKIDLIDENGFTLASAEKTFNIVEDEEYHGEYKLIDISEFESYKRINQFIGVKGVIGYNMIINPEEDLIIERVGRMYLIDGDYSLLLSTCYEYKKKYGEDYCLQIPFLTEGKAYIIIGKQTEFGFEIHEYRELDNFKENIGNNLINQIEQCKKEVENENLCGCSYYLDYNYGDLCSGVEISFEDSGISPDSDWIPIIKSYDDILVNDHNATSLHLSTKYLRFANGIYYIQPLELKEIIKYDWIKDIKPSYSLCNDNYCPHDNLDCCA